MNWELMHSESTKAMEDYYEKIKKILEAKVTEDLILTLTYFNYKGYFELAEVEYIFGYIYSEQLSGSPEETIGFNEICLLKEYLHEFLEAWDVSNSARKMKAAKDERDIAKSLLTGLVASDYVYVRGESNLSLLKKRNLDLFEDFSKELITSIGIDVREIYKVLDFIFLKYKDNISSIHQEINKISKGDKAVFIEEVIKYDKSSLLVTLDELATNLEIEKERLEKFFNAVNVNPK